MDGPRCRPQDVLSETPSALIMHTLTACLLSAGVSQAQEQKQGGMQMLFTMVLGGLVGATPHMVAASVMALARLMYEFAGQLEALAPQLLPVILSLLRSKSREIIKSVLGFLKVRHRRSALPVTLSLLRSKSPGVHQKRARLLPERMSNGLPSAGFVQLHAGSAVLASLTHGAA